MSIGNLFYVCASVALIEVQGLRFRSEDAVDAAAAMAKQPQARETAVATPGPENIEVDDQVKQVRAWLLTPNNSEECVEDLFLFIHMRRGSVWVLIRGASAAVSLRFRSPLYKKGIDIIIMI